MKNKAIVGQMHSCIMAFGAIAIDMAFRCNASFDTSWEGLCRELTCRFN